VSALVVAIDRRRCAAAELFCSSPKNILLPCLAEDASTTSNSVCFGDNGGMLSEFGKVEVDCGETVLVAAERLTDLL